MGIPMSKQALAAAARSYQREADIAQSLAAQWAREAERCRSMANSLESIAARQPQDPSNA